MPDAGEEPHEERRSEVTVLSSGRVSGCCPPTVPTRSNHFLPRTLSGSVDGPPTPTPRQQTDGQRVTCHCLVTASLTVTPRLFFLLRGSCWPPGLFKHP